jgi:lipopolysaccharide export system permease protein
MKILNRYLGREIIKATLFVLVGLLTLFAFFDLMHELGDLGKGRYGMGLILMFVLLSVPNHVYELAPVAVLIGTLFALARMVANSEFTVLRVSGLSAQRIGFFLLLVGLGFTAVTFIFGEFIAPSSQNTAQQLRLKATSSMVAQEFRSGLWVKDGPNFVNVAEMLPDTTLLNIKIYEFDSDFHLRTISSAAQGHFRRENMWQLHDVVQTRFEEGRATVTRFPEKSWESALNPDLLSVLLVVPEQMSVWNLYRYVEHLRENKQKSGRYEIALWGKLTYPFAAMVLMLLALPFSYHHSRAGGVGGKVFVGIMLGLGFHLLNRLFAHLGLLNGWPPLFSAIFPTLLFLLVAVGLMWRVERR